MFVLRTMAPDAECVPVNQFLGESYHLVLKQTHPKEFKSILKTFWNLDHPDEAEQTYGFIVYQNGSKYSPLYKGQFNYIMTSDGKTFENVSLK